MKQIPHILSLHGAPTQLSEPSAPSLQEEAPLQKSALTTERTLQQTFFAGAYSHNLYSNVRVCSHLLCISFWMQPDFFNL